VYLSQGSPYHDTVAVECLSDVVVKDIVCQKHAQITVSINTDE